MRLMTPGEVATELGLSQGALAQMRYMGAGPDYVKLNGRNVRYRESDVEAWINRSTVRVLRADEASL